MSLPAPNLDDRRFQDIVDDAKRRIHRICPDWTDHNVSDPGIALVELFAWMTEMTLYRLNQVPDRLYIKFLELVGVELFSAVPARAELLFTLTGPRDTPVRVPAGTQVSTERGDDEAPVVFMTDEDLRVVPPRLTACLVHDGTRYSDHWDDLRRNATSIPIFPLLDIGTAVYFGLADSAAGNLIRLDVTTGPEGAGIDPRHPPRAWDAWDGTQWQPVRILADTSAGFNSTGQVTLLLPQRHEALALAAQRAHWIRCRLTTPEQDQPGYTNSPVLESLTAVALGGVARAHHAEPAPAERLGTSDGRPGQTFQVGRVPVLPRRPHESVRVVPPRYEGAGEPEGQPWTEVADFAEATEADHVYTWSGATGEIRFGPRVLDRQGLVRQHGAVPPIGAQISVTGYRYGGGRRGNVAAHRLTVLHTSIPFVAAVTNLDPSGGGVDPETVENAKVRGPMLLRGGRRAVTAEDVERLTLDAAQSVARARCLPPDSPGEPARLLVVPYLDKRPEDLTLDDLAVTDELEEQIKAYLEPRRLLSMRLRIETPRYQGVKVAAEVRAGPGVRVETVREQAERALYQYINPLVGGPTGQGWPFGADLRLGDVYGVLHSSFGVQGVEAVHFFSADLRRGRTLDQVDQRLRLQPGTLFMSYEHRVVVQQ
ncbi:putative baseplate assembly protein [Actinoplanes regularis]|uniref:Putative baseplate assembly protein n=1 Tax=Actinoplanes regularis TaxID=52697 RepID=A0A239FNV4_9ACTN|nr:putative baseplate assembly protein [Actinoplanes regularis]GIE89674.1 putative baseplate assembly protein [Actinoplanes regularis]SNS57913.1 putative baseplate assembly protein [Actinoplanes regularis]